MGLRFNVLIVFTFTVLLLVGCSVEGPGDDDRRGGHEGPNPEYLDSEDDSNGAGDSGGPDLDVEVLPFPQIDASYVTFAAAEGTYAYDGKTPVYVTFNSHNEDSWGSVVGNEQAYTSYRRNLVEKLKLISENGAKLHWQTDTVVLEAMAEFEDSIDNGDTNGKHILKYISEDLGFSIDPHSHSTLLSDVAYLIEEEGVSSSSVVGGVLAFECEDNGELEGSFSGSDWYDELFLSGDGLISGGEYDYSWEPSILSGAGMGGHFYDDFSSGIWKPGNEDDFYEHDSRNDLVHIGTGYSSDKANVGNLLASGAVVYYENGGYVRELASMIESGKVPSGKMYTATIHLRDLPTVRVKDGSVEDTLEGLSLILGELEPLVSDGLVEYVLYDEAVSIWEGSYGAEANILPFSQFSMYDSVLEQAKGRCR